MSMIFRPAGVVGGRCSVYSTPGCAWSFSGERRNISALSSMVGSAFCFSWSDTRRVISTSWTPRP